MEPELLVLLVCCIALLLDDMDLYLITNEYDEGLFEHVLCMARCTRENMAKICGYYERVVPQYSSITFRRHFRLTKHAVEKICTLVGQSDHLKFRMDNGGRIPISIPKQLLVTLWYLGNQECLRSSADRFGVVESSVLVCVRRMCLAIIAEVKPHYIKWPSGNTITTVINGFQVKKVSQMS